MIKVGDLVELKSGRDFCCGWPNSIVKQRSGEGVCVKGVGWIEDKHLKVVDLGFMEGERKMFDEDQYEDENICGGGFFEGYTVGDPVHHPTHYTNAEGNLNEHGVECILAIEASMPSLEFDGYLKGNVLKYLWRYGYKGKPLEDLKKARWYLEKLIKKLEKTLDTVPF